MNLKTSGCASVWACLVVATAVFSALACAAGAQPSPGRQQQLQLQVTELAQIGVLGLMKLRNSKYKLIVRFEKVTNALRRVSQNQDFEYHFTNLIVFEDNKAFFFGK